MQKSTNLKEKNPNNLQTTTTSIWIQKFVHQSKIQCSYFVWLTLSLFLFRSPLFLFLVLKSLNSTT